MAYAPLKIVKAETLRDLVGFTQARPGWQAGKLNGIGGKIEEGESPYKAMVREFREEAGIYVPEWWQFCTLRFRGQTDPSDGGGTIYFFKADISMEDSHKVRTVETEKVSWHPVDAFWKLPHISNLRWLIPMARENIEANTKTI